MKFVILNKLCFYVFCDKITTWSGGIMVKVVSWDQAGEGFKVHFGHVMIMKIYCRFN